MFVCAASLDPCANHVAAVALLLSVFLIVKHQPRSRRTREARRGLQGLPAAMAKCKIVKSNRLCLRRVGVFGLRPKRRFGATPTAASGGSQVLGQSGTSVKQKKTNEVN